MNDSVSINSSSYSSSSASNSNSNSLNRSLFANQTLNSSVNTSTNSSSSCGNTTASSTASSSRNSGRYGHVLYMMDDYLPMQLNMTPGVARRRRTKSQTMNIYGDEVNTVAEHNKQLIEDLMMLKRQLREKDEVILKLNEIRNNLESEIQELSASLFEEAYAMVNDARAEAAQSDKLLKEANGKIEVLQAEVKALKELVLTSTPSTPNKHLHPQLSTQNGAPPRPSGSGGHSRQSSLNSQALNNIIHTSLNGSVASVTGSNSNLNQQQQQPSNVSLVVPPHKIQQQQSLHPSMLMASSSSSSFKDTNTKTLPHSSTSVQPLSTILNKVHKRAPSQNDIITNKPISFIDKLFQTTSSNKSKNVHQQQYYTENYSNDAYTQQNSLEVPEVCTIC